MRPLVRRSILTMPANVRKFVEKAYMRGADAICLDLEDSVPESKKDEARQAVREAIAITARGGSDILVRVNNRDDLKVEDIEASIWPGLTGVILPKSETSEEIQKIDESTTRIEKVRGLQPNSIEIGVMIESAKGVVNALEVATGSSRITFMIVGDEDLCLDLGISPSGNGDELFYVKSRAIIVSRAAGITPIGLLGTITDFSDLEALRRSALKAKKLGFKGSICVHPSQVPILNEVFSPTVEEIRYAKKIIEVFNGSLAAGRASVAVDGRMVDTPAYERAKKTLEWVEAIERMDARKTLALKSSSAGG